MIFLSISKVTFQSKSEEIPVLTSLFAGFEIFGIYIYLT